MEMLFLLLYSDLLNKLWNDFLTTLTGLTVGVVLFFILKQLMRTLGISLWQRIKQSVIIRLNCLPLLWLKFKRNLWILFKKDSSQLRQSIAQIEGEGKGVFLFFSPIKRLNNVGIEPMYVKLYNTSDYSIDYKIRKRNEEIYSGKLLPRSGIGEVVSPYDLAKFVNREIFVDINTNSENANYCILPFEQQPRLTIDRILDKSNYSFALRKQFDKNTKRRWMVKSCLGKVVGKSETNNLDYFEPNDVPNVENKTTKIKIFDFHKSSISLREGHEAGFEQQKISFDKEFDSLIQEGNEQDAVFIFGVGNDALKGYIKNKLNNIGIISSRHNDEYDFNTVEISSIEVHVPKQTKSK